MTNSLKDNKTYTITSKGQITVPIEWRKRFGDITKVTWREQDNKLILEPALDEGEWEEYVDFRGINPDGVPIEDVIAALEKEN